MTPADDDLDLYREPSWSQSWPLPVNVQVEDDHLVFQMSDHWTLSGDAGMLERFLALADAPAHTIADYAQEWGVLGLCRHNYPAHWRHKGGGGYNPASGYAHGNCDWTLREPVSAWRGISHLFGTLLDVAGRIEQHVPSDPDQTKEIARLNGNWRYPRVEDLDTWAERPEADRRRWQLASDRLNLTDAMSHLLANSVQVVASYQSSADARPVMSFAGRSLVDALALQTAMAACRAESVVSCDGCGAAFVPSGRYRPRPGQRRFCDTCRARGVPQKFASRDRRARLRDKKGK